MNAEPATGIAFNLDTAVTITASYDPDARAAYVRVRQGVPVASSGQLSREVIADYALDGSLVGLEILGLGPVCPLEAPEPSVACPDTPTAKETK